MVEAGVFGEFPQQGKYSDRLAPLLRVAHRDFLQYKRDHKLECSQPRFTPSRLSRTLQSSCLTQQFQ